MDWICHVTESVFAAYRGISKLPPGILAVPGYSSPQVRHLLNNLCDLPESRYLEVGTWQGATALSASYLNSGSFKAIDNFSEFGGQRDACLRHREQWSGRCRFELIDADCWAHDVGTLGPVNTSFNDGAHGEDDQYRAFTKFGGILTDPFIAIVDDWNWGHVRKGTHRAFTELSFHTLATWNLYSPGNCTNDGWWNGLFLAVVSRSER